MFCEHIFWDISAGTAACLLSIWEINLLSKGFPDGSAGKESACSTRDTRDAGSIPGLGISPSGGKWQPT